MIRLSFSFLVLTIALLNIVQANRDPIRLTHGPMLGHPTSESVRVWARTSDPGEFFVRFGMEEDNLTQISKSTLTKIENDNAGFVTLEKLLPNQRYHYQVIVNSRPHGLPGSFLTLPNSKLTQNPEYNPKGLFNLSLIHI